MIETREKCDDQNLKERLLKQLSSEDLEFKHTSS